MLAREQLAFDHEKAIQTLSRAEKLAKGMLDKAVERWLRIVREMAT